MEKANWVGKEDKKYLLLIIGIFIILHIPYLFQPISGGHAWRQSDTASVAKNFYLESWNFFLPRIDMRGNLSGIMGMELPVLPYLTAIIYKLIGGVWDGGGKLISLIFGSLNIWIFSLLIARITKISVVLTGFAMSVLPILWLYSGRFMPENTSLFFIGLSLYGSFRFFETDKKKYILLIAASLALGILTRPFVIFWGVSLFILIFLLFKRQKYMSSALIVLAGFFAVALFSLWYLWWVPYINARYSAPSYIFMGNISVLNALGLFTDITFWKKFLFLFGEDYIAWLWIPLFFLGIYAGLKEISKTVRIASWLLLAGGILNLFFLTVLVQNHYIIHNYYLYSFIPFSVYFNVLGLNKLFKISGRLVKTAILILLTVGNLGSVLYTYSTDKKIKSLVSLRNKTSSEIKNKLIVVGDAGKPTVLYSLHMRGFSVPETDLTSVTTLSNLKKSGAAYCLLWEDKSPVIKTIDDCIIRAKR